MLFDGNTKPFFIIEPNAKKTVICTNWYLFPPNATKTTPTYNFWQKSSFCSKICGKSLIECRSVKLSNRWSWTGKWINTPSRSYAMWLFSWEYVRDKVCVVRFSSLARLKKIIISAMRIFRMKHSKCMNRQILVIELKQFPKKTSET